MTRGVVAGYLAAAVLISFGAAWFSFGLGLVTAGVCAAALTTLLLVDVEGDA